MCMTQRVAVERDVGCTLQMLISFVTRDVIICRELQERSELNWIVGLVCGLTDGHLF